MAKQIEEKTLERLTGYSLSRNWFDFCFENPEKIFEVLYEPNILVNNETPIITTDYDSAAYKIEFVLYFYRKLKSVYSFRFRFYLRNKL